MDGQSRRKTLQTIDTNHLSSIPQPSARKPSRPSQVPSASYGNPHHQRQSSYGEGRLSYAPGNSQGANAQSGQRRSSTYTPGHRNSSMGGMNVLSQNASQAPSKDPRPVRDKQFKDQSIHRIIGFLQESGYPQHVVPKTLTTPTQKEFVSIFQYLYNKFDPSFRFIKKIDEDVLFCLKALKYPFADNISRSQLTAVGSPHSWPNMLAVLTWMVETLDMMDRLLKGEIQVEDNEADNPDKLYFNHFLTKAYQVFLAGADDYSEMEQDLENESDRQNEAILQEIERLEHDNMRLQRELHDLNASQPPLQALQQEREILLSDKTKFSHYIKHKEEKAIRTADANVKLAQMLKDAEVEFEKLGEQKLQLQEQVDAQDISATDVEKMNSEHEALIKNLELATTQLHEASSQLYEKERLAQDRMESLDKAVQTYNTLACKIGVVPRHLPRARNIAIELDFVSPLDSEKSWLGCQPQDLLSVDLRKVVKPFLSQLRQSLGTEAHEHESERLKLSTLYDQVKDAQKDKQEELESIEAKLSSIQEQYDVIKDTTNAETSASNAQAESMERDLAIMRNSAQNGLIQLDQKTQSVSIEYEQLLQSSTSLREQVTNNVIRTLDHVLAFKIHIQESLEALDAEANDFTDEKNCQGASLG